MNSLYEIKNSMDKEIFQKVHDYSLRVLEQTGMKFYSDEILKALENNGAKINRTENRAFFPVKIVENMIAELKKEVENGKDQLMLNGGVCFNTGDKIICKLGAAAPDIFDFEEWKKREATENDVIDSIKLGEAVDEIGHVGCAIYCKELDGKKINPNFTPIINAMLLAKNTRKLKNSEVNTAKQLKYLIEMGIVIRGSIEEFRKNPCFITAKESISPLVLPGGACEVLLALARNGLPAIMIPMPIIGTSMPVSIIGAMVLNNAEVLGSMTAIRSAVPGAQVGGGSIASVMDMSTGKINFDNVASTRLDAAMAQMYSEFYNLDYGYGVYCADSKSLGPEVIYERMMKLLGGLFVKKYNYVVGLYDQGMIYSHELALIEVDIVKSLHLLISDIKDEDLDIVLETVNKVGPGGSFLGEQHTLKNFKKNWKSEILGEFMDIKNNKKTKGMFKLANEKFKEILSNSDPYRLPKDKEKEIDNIVSKAFKDIIGD